MTGAYRRPALRERDAEPARASMPVPRDAAWVLVIGLSAALAALALLLAVAGLVGGAS
jgi:hypothetical protein